MRSSARAKINSNPFVGFLLRSRDGYDPSGMG
jgi:hypothetical protein